MIDNHIIAEKIRNSQLLTKEEKQVVDDINVILLGPDYQKTGLALRQLRQEILSSFQLPTDSTPENTGLSIQDEF